MCFCDFMRNHFVALFHPSGEATRRGQNRPKRVRGTSGPKMDRFVKETVSLLTSSDSPSGKRFLGGQRGPPRRGSARGNPRVSGDQVSTKIHRARFRISDLEKKRATKKLLYKKSTKVNSKKKKDQLRKPKTQSVQRWIEKINFASRGQTTPPTTPPTFATTTSTTARTKQ